MKKILVIGSLNMDQVLQIEHTPVPGETILCQDMKLVCGGKGANQAFTCGRLGCHVEMLGSVGQDENGDALLKIWSRKAWRPVISSVLHSSLQVWLSLRWKRQEITALLSYRALIS